jgi:hypothetical protein
MIVRVGIRQAWIGLVWIGLVWIGWAEIGRAWIRRAVLPEERPSGHDSHFISKNLMGSRSLMAETRPSNAASAWAARDSSSVGRGNGSAEHGKGSVETVSIFMRVSYAAESRLGDVLAGGLACGTKDEGVFSWRDQSHWNSGIAVSVALLRFQPEAQSWIVNLRLVIPEIWSQSALDEQMIELKLNLRGAPGKVAAYVARANVEAGYAMTNALWCDNHWALRRFDASSGGFKKGNTYTTRISEGIRIEQRQQAEADRKRSSPNPAGSANAYQSAHINLRRTINEAGWRINDPQANKD